MKLAEIIEKTRLLVSFCMTPLLVSLVCGVALIGCGDTEDEDTERETRSEMTSSPDTDEMPEDYGPPCPAAEWLHLPSVNVGAVIDVTAPEGMQLRTATVLGNSETTPETLSDDDAFEFEAAGTHTVFAEVDGEDCSATTTHRVVEVFEAFPTTNGIEKDDPNLQAWATGWSMPVMYGASVVEMWQTPERAMGPATGQTSDVMSLGEGGQIELFFDGEIFNGEGPDFAIFENSFSPTFLELALVSVSSDGVHYAQFPVIYLGTVEIDPYGDHEPTLFYGFAGRYPAGVGTPFDLDTLKYHPDVRSGLVALDRITSVRIKDVIGDGSLADSFGRPIFDPFPTSGSGGFDLEAVGVMHLNEVEQLTQNETMP